MSIGKLFGMSLAISLVSIASLWSLSEASVNPVHLEKDGGDSSLLAASVQKRIHGIDIPFVPNLGQKDSRVKFYATTFGGTVFVTDPKEIVYSLPMTGDGGMHSGWVIKEQLIGGKAGKIEPGKQTLARVHIFEGRNPLGWKRHIPTYRSISMGEVYPGIDLELKAHENNVEKVFSVRPGADVASIKVRLEGAELIRITKNGELEVSTALGAITFTKPAAWQEINGAHVDVPVKYALMDSTDGAERLYGFSVAEYDRSVPLILDPLLSSTFIGGSADDYIYDMLLDASGEVVITGYTFSADYPAVPGAFDTSYNGGNHDVFVAKLNSDLTALLAATFLGGSNYEHPHSLVLDAAGNVVLTGTTKSPNYPTTVGAYQTTLRGEYDVFISMLSQDLSSLLASTLIGGSLSEDATRVALNPAGEVYVVGVTGSSDYPVTAGAYDTSYNGSGDVFVSRFDHALGRLLSSTFLGGSRYDDTYTLSLDAAGNAFIAGYTSSMNFPVTAGVYDTTYNGGTYDVFVAKLTGDLRMLSASTFLGGGDLDFAQSLVADGSGGIVIAGRTESSTFPTTPGAYRVTPGGGSDAFVARMDDQLIGLMASTLIGGSHNDAVSAMMLDRSGNIVIAGSTSSSDYPAQPDAYDVSYNGGSDAFVTRLDGGLRSLLASTFLGGHGDDSATAIALDRSGAVFIAGYTNSTDYPATAGAYDTSWNGGHDSFVAKLDIGISSNNPPQSNAGPDQTVECTSPQGSAVTLDGAESSDPESDPLTYTWTKNGNIIATGVNPTLTFSYGSHAITLTVDDGKGGTASDDVVITVQDTTPPRSMINGMAGTMGNNGWYRSTVTVILLATDACTGVQEIRYSVDGEADTVVPGENASVTITQDGTHGIAYFATDREGNIETPLNTQPVKIDQTDPLITAATAPLPNHDGWNKTDVIVTFSCSDATSSIASCTSPVTVTAEGSGQIVNGTAVDAAGNDAVASVTVNVDKASPVITAAVNPAPNANGWNNTDVTVTFSCSDALSGIAFCPEPITVMTEGAGQVVSGTAVDKAGNPATASVSLNIDKTAPTLSISANLGMLWPPNHKMVTVTPIITVADSNSGTSVKLVSVTSSEPDNGLGDGDKANDIVINADGTLSLRAERSGKGTGRVYTITYQGTDIAGNTSAASATVTVPHDMR